ncbi:MAG: YraN family protein [Novosphingobium sp.]|uniref:YraN family protein n=1 Tax=Novosphingobium sp. TaxID=1874826 RepID=UPI001DDBF3E2|nr:YraN family protein [Novosphingobium sp.]MCB2058065.1 YraN family protein [Novosphingobium sp.]MCP5388037.1 YraN family protein [Novosphingobium sp.]
MSERARREAQGRRGESLAAWFLRLKGWRIVARRVKTPRGEIDLVARRGKVVAFVEVKWRQRDSDLDLALDDYRLRRVRAAVEAAAHRYAKPGDEVRIDAVLLAPGRFPRHMANALIA